MRIFAYLDAGTGSILVQAIIGAVVGVGVFVKTFWSRIAHFFNKNKKPATKATTKTAESSKSSE